MSEDKDFLKDDTKHFMKKVKHTTADSLDMKEQILLITIFHSLLMNKLLSKKEIRKLFDGTANHENLSEFF